MQHCCDKMEISITPQFDIISYDPESRDYLIKLYGDQKGRYIAMRYCPWCGTKLPQSLNMEWCEAVKQDLGLEDVDAEEWAKLPEKYKTEQWWRERGL